MSISNFQDFLTCKICSQPLNIPLLLPCNHSFCTNCIKDLISRQKNKCPFCNVEFPTTTTVDTLKDDFVCQKVIQSQYILSQVQEKNSFCEKCKNKTEAASFCVHCQSFLCQLHTDAHKSEIDTAGHSIVAVQDSVNELSISSPLCPIHRRPTEAFLQHVFLALLSYMHASEAQIPFQLDSRFL